MLCLVQKNITTWGWPNAPDPPHPPPGVSIRTWYVVSTGLARLGIPVAKLMNMHSVDALIIMPQIAFSLAVLLLLLHHVLF